MVSAHAATPDPDYISKRRHNEMSKRGNNSAIKPKAYKKRVGKQEGHNIFTPQKPVVV